MTRDIDFFHFLDSPSAELPVEFSDCVQVQNISGRTIEVVNDVFSMPLSTFLANAENEKVKQLIDKKMLKVRSFTTSASASAVATAEEPKKKRNKKGPSISSHQPLEGAVADLAAVITGEKDAVPASAENVEQLVETDSSEEIKLSDASSGEGSPETDNKSV